MQKLSIPFKVVEAGWLRVGRPRTLAPQEAAPSPLLLVESQPSTCCWQQTTSCQHHQGPSLPPGQQHDDTGLSTPDHGHRSSVSSLSGARGGDTDHVRTAPS